MDVDLSLPGHGDLGTKQDVEDANGFLGDLQAGVKDANAKEMSREAIKALSFPRYKDWRNSHLAPAQLETMHHLLTTGKSIYLDRE